MLGTFVVLVDWWGLCCFVRVTWTGMGWLRAGNDGMANNGIGINSSWYVRRADAQKALYDAAAQLGVQFLFSARIASINQSHPSITLSDNSILHADLIIGADGHASLIRDSIFPSPTPEKRTGVVFQVPIPYPLPATLPLALHSHSSQDKAFTFFVGPGRYAVVWPAKEYLDIQLGDEEYPHPSIHNAAQLSDMAYLRQRFADFSPTLSALLSTVEDTHRWRIAFLPPLENWRSPSGRVVLIGDAAHAMGPYAGQGAGQGIEDAAVLSELLHPSIMAEDIATMTELYQALRKPRAEKVQRIAWKYREYFTVGDGPVQRRRDELFAKLEGGMGSEGQSRDEAWLEEYDAVGEARSLLRRVRGQSRGDVVVEAKL
jgi:salicylate hydroxylase